MLVVYEIWTRDGDRLLYWPSSISFSSWLGCSIVGHWEPKALILQAVLRLASCLQLTPTDSSCPGLLVILLSYIHLLPLFFRLCTPVHLLIVARSRVNIWLLNCMKIKLTVWNTWNRLPRCQIELLVLHSNTWNHLTVCKWMNTDE